MSKYKVITLGTPTSTGGKVVSASSDMVINGQKVALINDLATCNCGDKKCNKQGRIIKGAPRDFKINGIEPAVEGDQVLTTCGKCFLLSSGHDVGLGEIMGQSITIGGNGNGVSFGDGVSFNLVAHTPYAQSQNVSSPSLANSLGTSSAGQQTVGVNPKNTYWPPYNFLAKDGEKEIHIRYTQDVVETTVLAPEEWKEFFDALDKTQNIGGAMKGTYDAFDTAKKLGGLGVTAYVKPYNGVDYLILKGYKQHMKTLLAGNRFKASNPQVVKLGLGALDSVKGMARYVKVTAPMEILVGSAINVLQYVLNDEYTLKQLGIDEAKLLIGVFSSTALAGGILGVLAVASIPVTFLAGTLIIVGSGFAVWTVDKTTDFQNKIVKAALENFN